MIPERSSRPGGNLPPAMQAKARAPTETRLSRRPVQPLISCLLLGLGLAGLQTGQADSPNPAIRNQYGGASRREVQITAPAPPRFSTHPAGRSVEEGDWIGFFAAALGPEPITYHWLKDGSPVLKGVVDGGGVNYFVDPATLEDAGGYSVIASNRWGTATSDVARINITPAPPNPDYRDRRFVRLAAPGMAIEGTTGTIFEWRDGKLRRQFGAVEQWGSGIPRFELHFLVDQGAVFAMAGPSQTYPVVFETNGTSRVLIQNKLDRRRVIRTTLPAPILTADRGRVAFLAQFAAGGSEVYANVAPVIRAQWQVNGSLRIEVPQAMILESTPAPEDPWQFAAPPGTQFMSPEGAPRFFRLLEP